MRRWRRWRGWWGFRPDPGSTSPWKRVQLVYLHHVMTMRAIIAFCAALCMTTMHAQTTFAPIGAKWSYKQAYWGGPDTNLMVLEVVSDTLIDGRKVSSEIKLELAAKVTERKKLGKKIPHLAIILVGDDGALIVFGFCCCGGAGCGRCCCPEDWPLADWALGDELLGEPEALRSRFILGRSRIIACCDAGG